MTTALSLLSGLLRLREQAVVARPAVGDEFRDASERPSSLELADDVNQVVARTKAEVATRLDQRVCRGQAFGAFGS